MIFIHVFVRFASSQKCIKKMLLQFQQHEKRTKKAAWRLLMILKGK